MWHVFNRFWFERPRKLSFLLLLCIFTVVSLYFISIDEFPYEKIFHKAKSSYDKFFHNQNTLDSSKYLVYNKKCRMLSMKPNDPSIRRFVKKENFETCSSKQQLSSISRISNGSIYLIIDKYVAEDYVDLSCCWSLISRSKDREIDSTISIGPCQKFDQEALLNKSVEVVFVNCTTDVKRKNNKKTVSSKIKNVYQNVHAIINPERVSHRLKNGTSTLTKNSTTPESRKALSVLMLGIDSVSRLNFYRTMPSTCDYFKRQGWVELLAYNKVGDNTLPNLMAILTGQNQMTANKCHEKMPYNADNCSLIWYNFRNANYVTAYAEDQSWISTFNYDVSGFVEPPTDYYFRPYVLASEQLLEVRRRFSAKYCTGPELSVDRIFDSAVEFSKTFINRPYFGFFWTNGISHDYINAPSSYDSRFLDKLRDMENHGVMNDTMIVVLSDHGMRYGDSRDTFIGWYEERLPMVYIWLPQWFREQHPDSYDSLLINQNRLTSPYDLYETLRDILQRAGGQAPSSSGCPSCSSLFEQVPLERGCKDAGISPHWCTCAGFELYDMDDPIAFEGAQHFVDYMNNVTDQYKTKNGIRLCSRLTLSHILRVKKLVELDEDTDNKILKLFYLIEVMPGGGKFETTISYHGPGKYTIEETEISRINLYGHSAKCLKKGDKRFCQCETPEKQ